MNHLPRGIGLGIGSALLVPTILTHAFTTNDRLGLGLSSAPFGWQVVMIVHLVASLPIGLVTAEAILHSSRRRHRWISTVGWALVGLAGSSAVGLWGEAAAAILRESQAGFLAGGLVRAILGFLLVLPWLMAAGWLDGPDRRRPVSPFAFVVGATLALLPPLVFENQLIETRSIELDAHLDTGRLKKAQAVWLGLDDLGGPRPVGGSSSHSRNFKSLEATLRRMERDASRDLPESAVPSTRLERAFLLIQLDRLDEAELILRSVSSAFPDAFLLLGAVYRDQSRWSDSERAYRAALDRFLPEAPRNPDALEGSATAYDGLAEAARSSGRPEVAERAYLEARRRLPTKAGYFAFQIGRHYLSGGRPAEAIAQLRQAVQLDPALEKQVRPMILQARVRTPACLLQSSYR